jgi:hypothetical protein
MTQFKDLQDRAKVKGIRLTKSTHTFTPWGWRKPTYELYHPEVGKCIVHTLKEVVRELEEFEKELGDLK